MGALLARFLRFGGWFAVAFVITVAVLWAGSEHLPKLRQAPAEAAALQVTADALEARARTFPAEARARAQEADDELGRLRSAGSVELARAERDLIERQRRARADVLTPTTIAARAIAGDHAAITAHYRALHLELPLNERALKVVRARRGPILEIEELVRRHNDLARSVRRAQESVPALEDAAKDDLPAFICDSSPVGLGCVDRRALDQRTNAINNDLRRLAAQSQDIERRVALSRRIGEAEAAAGRSAAIADHAARALAGEARAAARRAQASAWNRTRNAFAAYGPKALLIVIALFAVPFLHRVAAYQLIAPLAARRRARLLPPGPSFVAGGSAPTLKAPLGPGSEILVRSGLVAVPARIDGADIPVLDWRAPFTCLAAGLTGLQRLRAEHAETITLTGPTPHAQLAVVHVPSGGAAVVRPRAIVALARRRGARTLVTRRWRFGWIAIATGRLRHLVFHGPVSLVLAGTGGVIRASANEGRAIDGRLVLAHDAGLSLGVSRTPSFWPYATGRAPLVLDRFDGDGAFVHESRPGAATGPLPARIARRILDAVLNALGI